MKKRTYKRGRFETRDMPGNCHMLDVLVYVKGGEIGFPEATATFCATCKTVFIHGAVTVEMVKGQKVKWFPKKPKN